MTTDRLYYHSAIKVQTVCVCVCLHSKFQVCKQFVVFIDYSPTIKL